MTVKLTAKFFANSRGLTLLDSASVTWAINSNTNEISATAAGGAGTGTVTNVATGAGLTGGPITTTGTISLANIADQRLFGNVSGGAAPPVALTAAQGKTLLAIAYTDVSGLATVAHTGAYSDLTGTPAGAALTKTNDTNVTLTLGGSPTTALLNAASLTLGWTGTLGLVRGGTGADLSGTGGSSQVLKQTTLGGAVTVGQLAYTDITGLATVAHSGAYSDLSGTPSIPIGANPTASLGLTAVNGVAATFMRSDGAPAIDQSISPTWTGTHNFSNPVGLANGALATPSITFTGDTNNGLAYNTTDDWYLVAGGVAIANARLSGTTRNFKTGDGTNAIATDINGAAGATRSLRYQSGTSGIRWDLRANATAESGSNAGSDYDILGFNDAGTSLGTYVRIMRATGGILVPSGVTGGDKGAGTINATGLYVGGTAVLTSAVTSLAATLPLTVSGSTGSVTVAGEYLERRTSNYTNTTTGSTDIFTGITTVANAVYLVEAFITTQCSSTGGNKFRITAPTGSTVEGWFDGTTSSVTTLSRQRITAINTLSGTAMNTVATTPAPLYVWALVTTSSTTGTLSVGGADVTSGQTNTVFAGSNLRISRIA